MNKIDLHIHTIKSDGLLTPKEIIDEAIKNNVKYISITDHDTINAYDDDMINYAKEKGVILIPGVELSTKIKKCGIHILGYNIDIKNKEFNNRLKKIRDSRYEYLFKVTNKLRELGYIVNYDKLKEIESVTKAHISFDVINNMKNKELLLKEFNHIPSKGEFIEKVMNEGCPAYVEKMSISPKEAGELIKSVNGKVVLAHPVAYVYEDNLNEEDIQEIINDMDIDGIEANYIYVDRNNIKHNDTKKWNDFSKKNNLFVTIGSDFHYYNKLKPRIGLIDEEIEVNVDEIVNNILKIQH